jgi:hypothetical protein
MLTPYPQCSSSADYLWCRGARSGNPEQNQAPPDANPQANVANGTASEHNVARERVFSNATTDHPSAEAAANAPVDLETPPDDVKTVNLSADDLSRFQIHHYFDFVAGTSTGG